MRRTAMAALARQEMLHLRALPGPVVAYLAMPVVMMVFLQPSFEIILKRFGYPSANGAELVVPAMATMFGFFLAGHHGLILFNEHQWGIWRRLRGCSATPAEILLAKAGVHVAHQATQYAVLVGAIGVALGLRGWETIPGIVVIGAATVILIVAFAGFAAAVSPSQAVFDSFCYGGGVAFAAIGGGIAPFSLLPEWCQRVAPASPMYWTLKGFRQAILDHAALADVAGTSGVLIAMAAVLALGAAARLDPSQPKVARVR